MTMVDFRLTILVVPKPWRPPRAAVIGKKTSNPRVRFFPVAYVPEYEKKIEETVLEEAKRQGLNFPLDEPLGVEATFWFDKPKSEQRKKTLYQRMWKYTKPDLDNITKSTMDGIENAILVNDSRVCLTFLRKIYNAHGEHPRIDIRIFSLKNEDIDILTLDKFTVDKEDTHEKGKTVNSDKSKSMKSQDTVKSIFDF